MAWDLRAALLKKGEFETARLVAFEFRERARTMRLLSAQLFPERATDALVREIALADDDAILAKLIVDCGLDEGAVRAAYAACRAEARRQLIVEIGDPTPHRLG